MTPTATPQEFTDEGRQFLQFRVARFGLYASTAGWFFVAFRVIDALNIGGPGVLFGSSMLFHVLAATSLLVIWISCRGGARSPAFLRAMETGGTLLACGFYAVMGLSIPLVAMPHYIVILALGLGLVARAIYVPSSGRRTLIVTGLAGIPLLIVTWFLYRDMDIGPWIDVAPVIAEMGNVGIAVNTTAFAAAWWLCFVLICWGASRVIYGLRKEVRDVRKLGQYTLVEKLGEGAMGTVYRARHAMLRRPTAVKLLPPDKAGRQHLARFEKEVQLTALLTHPNTVTIFDYGRTPDDVFYYAMELLDGATLLSIVEADGPQPPGRVISIVDQIAGALAEAHAVNLIHRDVKPANIMLVEQGGRPDFAKVLDFGLVKELERADRAGLTHSGAITGTPQYLSPEGLKAPDTVDIRSDIYALGAVAYFLLAGDHVFTAETVVEVCTKHINDEPEPIAERRGSSVPADLEAVILKCLAKDRDDRPQSAREVSNLLRECEDAGSWTDREAREWWERHGPELADMRRAEAVSGPGMTMDVARRGSTGPSVDAE
jgi:serine/threonine-protein kinase